MVFVCCGSAIFSQRTFRNLRNLRNFSLKCDKYCLKFVKYSNIVSRPNANAVQINKRPNENFGLDAPTPGMGIKWMRRKSEEFETQQRSPDLALLERYDRFYSSK